MRITADFAHQAGASMAVSFWNKNWPIGNFFFKIRAIFWKKMTLRQILRQNNIAHATRELNKLNIYTIYNKMLIFMANIFLFCGLFFMLIPLKNIKINVSEVKYST